jgi:GT2 family glycosyltransferase
MPLLSVIIVNYNIRFFLEQCLQSLYRAANGVSMEVIIADNQSTDGSAAYIKKLFPSVIWIQNATNMGFAKANNIGIRLARGQYTLLLNPDTLIPENTLLACLEYVRDNDLTATGIRMIDGCGSFLPESKRAFPAPLPAFFKLSGLASAFPRSAFFNRYALGHLSPEANHAVEVLAGAFMLVKTNALKALNGFDEKFFMYGEDIDLSYRLQQYSNRANAYLGTHPIIHFKGESTNRGSFRYLRHFYGAMHLFVKKHYEAKGLHLSGWVLRIAIYLRAALATALLPLSRQLYKSSVTKCIIIAGQPPDTSKVAAMLPSGIVSAASIFHKLPAEALPFLQSQKMPRNEVLLIWCIGNGLLLTEVIELLSQVKPYAAGIGYHYVGSGSVVGGAGSSSAGFGWGLAENSL